ncbi:EF-hand [Aureobasidium pullulans]|uniref:EF-hand n=1 Tax=Aureobasidium pullulans TaxID=5580 RepID=A0AB74IJ86_AURPU|nr:EF-hand [Aureobasidium pullulans]THX21913.1 EF-hand [Aureobasidium pullulans]THX47138.1 EF-hand [Aureobasidium pullulans]THX82872.1 EF-hand [Aureobasidium pullulans]
MSSPTKLSFNSPRSPRASPFRRPDSDGLLRSPSTVRDRSESPTKPLSPSLSPEKHNPFVRRPSQLTTGDRPRSPFARPTSRLSIAEPSSRPTSSGSLAPPISFSRHASVTSQTPVEREHSEPPSPSPVARNFEPPVPVDGAPSSPRAPPSPSPLVIPSSPAVAPSSPMGPRSPLLSPNANRPMRPTAQRTVTSSTQATIRAPVFGRPTSRDSTTSAAPRPSFTATSRPNFSAPVQMATGQYSHLPQSLLRSMRESFEVLDSSNTGAITSASVADMLQQMGMDSSPRAVAAFFPPNTPSTITLGRFLDLLSAPLAELSEPSELAAAFAAFDVDDSGQIDKHELRDALLNTAPEPGAEHMRLSEHEVDAIMSQFSARRAFGAKGVFGKELGGGDRKRGEVFRYRDFISNISGSGGADGAEQVAA